MAEKNYFYSDFVYFLTNRVLPLVGIPKTTPIYPITTISNFKEYVVKEEKRIVFGTNVEGVAFIEGVELFDPKNDISLIKNVLRSYLTVTRFDFKNKPKNKYTSNEHFHLVTDYALQNGISNWISGTVTSKNNVELLLNELDNWRLKTYEGKNVTFSFKLIDTEEEPKLPAGDFLKFIKEDFSAVLTDPTASLFILNKECDLIGYQTIFKGRNCNDAYPLGKNVPYRFSNLIQNEITDNSTIGISLLSNGDIIISKDRRIHFVKRGNKWLNFNGAAFRAALLSKGVRLSDTLIDSVFATALDVSFSHCGGIISCIDYATFQEEHNTIVDGKRAILHDKDNLLNLFGESSSKRKVIEMLVAKKNFVDIDRKLRCELSALDGACILDLKGEVVAFGAIIQNKSGSNGGGRGAAAQRLSTFGGFAVKISTDGYLELYVGEGDPVYTIK